MHHCCFSFCLTGQTHTIHFLKAFLALFYLSIRIVAKKVSAAQPARVGAKRKPATRSSASEEASTPGPTSATPAVALASTFVSSPEDDTLNDPLDADMRNLFPVAEEETLDPGRACHDQNVVAEAVSNAEDATRKNRLSTLTTNPEEERAIAGKIFPKVCVVFFVSLCLLKYYCIGRQFCSAGPRFRVLKGEIRCHCQSRHPGWQARRFQNEPQSPGSNSVELRLTLSLGSHSLQAPGYATSSARAISGQVHPFRARVETGRGGCRGLSGMFSMHADHSLPLTNWSLCRSLKSLPFSFLVRKFRSSTKSFR